MRWKRALIVDMSAMRADLRLPTFALVLATLAAGAHAQASQAPPPSDDERAVLMATRGSDTPKAPHAAPHAEPAAPPELDGSELQAWFDQQFGPSKAVLQAGPDAPAADIDDAEAEADLLGRIERNRKP